jgi:hypothetical protein
MKPPKKCMKIDQVLDSLFESESSDNNSDALSKSSSDSLEYFDAKEKSAKNCFRKSNSFQFDQKVGISKNPTIQNDQHDHLKQIEHLLEIKPIHAATSSKMDLSNSDDDDDDDDDDIPLGKLVCVKGALDKRNALLETTKAEQKHLIQIDEADDEKESDDDDDDEDDIPLFKLISRQDNSTSSSKNNLIKKIDGNETNEEAPLASFYKKKVFAEKTNIIATNSPSLTKKLRRLCKAKSTRNENNVRSSFLKGLYDFDCEDEDEDEVYSDLENVHANTNKLKSKIEDISLDVIDKNLKENSVPENAGLKSPVISMNSSEFFVLSLKNLKRKKSSKLLSNIASGFN